MFQNPLARTRENCPYVSGGEVTVNPLAGACTVAMVLPWPQVRVLGERVCLR